MKIKKKWAVGLAIGAVCLLLGGSVVDARTDDPTADFSVNNGNPNGVWSYGWMPTDFSSFNLLPYHSSDMWYGWGGDFSPHVWLNTGDEAYGVPNGWLGLHPGDGAEPAVLRWSAPDAGRVYVMGQFLPGDWGIMTVAVRHNNLPLWNATDFGSFNLTVDVATGDTIDFAVYGGYGGGNTPLRAAIAPIVYSAEGDFSTANGNPNGDWSYGWVPTDFSSFNVLPYHSSDMWYGWGDDFSPHVWLNTGDEAYGVPNGWLGLHPGDGAEPAVLRWSVPNAGRVYVMGQFLPGDWGIMTVAVRHNNVLLWSATDFGSFNLTVDVASGDTIDFAVYGGYGGGNTPLRAAIAPIVYSGEGDFSTANGNPNGVWSYGWMTTDFSTFTLYTGVLIDDDSSPRPHRPHWYREPASPDFTPCIWRNDDSVSHYSIAPGELALHPSSTGEASVLRWTAPSDGLWRIDGQFLEGDFGVMQVGIRQGNSWLWQDVDAGTFELTTSVMAGDSIDFLVYGGYGGGSTPLQLQISSPDPGEPIPEAGTILLMGLGLLSLGGIVLWRIRRGSRGLTGELTTPKALI